MEHGKLFSHPAGLSCELAGTDRHEELACLVSTILGRGHESASSRTAARRLLQVFRMSPEMARASVEEIRRCAKISVRQARLLSAALALGACLSSSPLRPGERFSTSSDLFSRYSSRFHNSSKECFLSLHLNSKNRLIREVLISVGSLSTSVVHPREVFSPAVRDSAAALIFLHNHPSGDPSPSREDHECTRRLYRAGRILGIRVLDHVVLGHEDYFSFADAGLLGEADH